MFADLDTRMRSDLGQIHLEGHLAEEKGGGKIGKKSA